MTAPCPFCDRIEGRDGLRGESALCVAFYDTAPLNPGHILIVPKRHQPDFLALSTDEHLAILRMAVALRKDLDLRFHPTGFNLGVNVGDAAGQTVGHAHLHLIPRYEGDVPDPRGGVRWVIPKRARYWPAATATAER